MNKNKGLSIVGVLITVVILVGATGGIAFLVKNRETGVQPGNHSSDENGSSWNIEILDGDIYKVHESGTKESLIDKKDFASESVQSFVSASLSPDKSKMCFVASTIVPMWLYYSDIDGGNITKIDLAKNCFWSHNSKLIAYNNHTTDVSSVDIYLYNTVSGEKKNLTGKESQEIMRVYNAPIWSEDDSKIRGEYTSFPFSNIEMTTKGVSVIDVSSGEVTDE